MSQLNELCDVVSGTHIKFVPGRAKPKTKTWNVISLVGESNLGSVAWFGRWRRYSFFPSPSTVFEQVCLREIANFCENQTMFHRRDHGA